MVILSSLNEHTISSCLYLYLADIPLIVIPQKMFSGMDVFSMLCIPGFILAGNLMNQGGISERIIRFCNCMVGHIRGGLAQANIITSMIFGVSCRNFMKTEAAVGMAASLAGMTNYTFNKRSNNAESQL